MQISVVVPLLNEEESLAELTNWIADVCTKNSLTYEVIFIDDGSSDNSWNVIQSLSASNNCIRGIKFRRNYGKSAALNEGFKAATGQIVITMDADLQDSADEIPGLYQRMTTENLDIISGWKKKRHDPLSKTLPTKLFNWATRKISGIHLHDFNCGLKAYQNKVVKNIEVYGEMHRYIPLIAKWNGFKKIGEQEVQHQARKFGTTKFGGWNRFINGFLDLMSITFVGKFSKRPMHFFGSVGTLSFLVGFIITFFLLFEKIYKITTGLPLREVTAQPLFYIALTSIIIGMQLFLAGFVAELLSRNNPDRKNYQIEKEIGF